MLKDKVKYQGDVITVLDFLKIRGATIIKPMDDENIHEEYQEVLEFISFSYRALSQDMQGVILAESIAEYTTTLLTSGEKAVDAFLVGPPTERVAVLLNKYSASLDGYSHILLKMFTINEIKDFLERRAYDTA